MRVQSSHALADLLEHLKVKRVLLGAGSLCDAARRERGRTATLLLCLLVQADASMIVSNDSQGTLCRMLAATGPQALKGQNAALVSQRQVRYMFASADTFLLLS